MNWLKPSAILMTLAALSLPPVANAGYSLRTVILSGDPVPGDPSISFFQGTEPVINELGQVAFKAYVAGSAVDNTNDLSLWSEGTGTLRMVVREGMAAPQSPPDYVFSNLIFSFETLNDAGTLLFGARLAGSGAPTILNTSVWKADSTGLSLIARPLAESPQGPPGIVFESMSGGSINNHDEVAFFATVSGIGPKSKNVSYWTHDAQGNTLFLLDGDSLPGVPGNGFLSGGAGPPDINDQGEVVFFANARSSTNVSFNGVWAGKTGDLRLIALEDQHAPGTSASTTFRLFQRTPFNNQKGDVAFLSQLRGVDVSTANDQGLWLDVAGQLSLVAREGDPAPGVTDGALFGTIYGDPNLNNNNQLTFRSTLTGSNITGANDAGIWFQDKSGLSLVAREGDSAPGTGSGVVFGPFASAYPALNDNGIVAFMSNLAGADVNDSNNRGLWAGRPGNLKLLLRSGDVLDIAEGPAVDLRTVSNVFFQNNGIQGEGSLNNQNQLAFNVLFTDGSEGIFVMNLGVIPEPSSAALMVLAVFYPQRHRKR